MSRRDRRDSAEGLELPAPRSPRDLDEKILRYARAQAPARQHRRQPGWLAGLAFASLAGVALLLVFPHRPGEIEQLPLAPREPASPSPGSPPAAAADAADAALGGSAAGRGPNLSLQRLPAAGAPAATSAAKLERARGAAVADGVREAETPEPASDEAGLADETIKRELRTIAALLAAGEQGEAQSAYAQLRASCGHCELPDSLAEALARWLPVTDD